MNVIPETMELIQLASAVAVAVFAVMVTFGLVARLIERSLWR